MNDFRALDQVVPFELQCLSGTTITGTSACYLLLFEMPSHSTLREDNLIFYT